MSIFASAMKKILIAALVLLGIAHPFSSSAQDKPLFNGAEFLDSCLVDLPLTYANKDKDRYTQAARNLKEVELIYLTYDKKSATATYSRIYVVAKVAKDGSEYVFVESTDDHRRVAGSMTAYFPRFTPKKQRFYNAACFDAQMTQHPELGTKLRQVPFGSK